MWWKKYVNRITGKSGSLLDSIKVQCNDGKSSNQFGGGGGNYYDTSENDRGFKKIDVRSGSLVDAIIINNVKYGGDGGSLHEMKCDTGKIIGIHGKSGAVIDNLGIYCDYGLE